MRTNKLNLNDEVNGKTVGELPKLRDDNRDVINRVSRVFAFEKSLQLKIANEKNVRMKRPRGVKIKIVKQGLQYKVFQENL